MPIKVREIKAFNTNFHNMLAAFTLYFVSICRRKFSPKYFSWNQLLYFVKTLLSPNFCQKVRLNFWNLHWFWWQSFVKKVGLHEKWFDEIFSSKHSVTFSFLYFTVQFTVCGNYENLLSQKTYFVKLTLQ